ncbi:hypothetical protein JCM17823_02220 [Halorubrum gandharaense]
MTLVRLIDAFDSAERSIVVVNRTEPDPIRNMLAETFGEGAIDISDRKTDESYGNAGDRDGAGDHDRNWQETVEALVGDGGADLDVDALVEAAIGDTASAAPGTDDADTISNLVLLVEEGKIVASSTLDEFVEAILLVNSDLYITGARELSDLDLPDVLTGLSETVFTLRGYPESNRQKLLLITISRFIERAASEAGAGTLRSSFQRLSRLEDEVGTREVYEEVVARGVDTHVYGVPDAVPEDLGATVHGGRTRNYTDTWFVVFRPEGGAERVSADDDLQRAIEGGIALLAVEVEDRLWKGVWTYDPAWVERIDGIIREEL